MEPSLARAAGTKVGFRHYCRGQFWETLFLHVRVAHMQGGMAARNRSVQARLLRDAKNPVFTGVFSVGQILYRTAEATSKVADAHCRYGFYKLTLRSMCM